MKINVTAQIKLVTPETASEWLADRWPTQRVLRSGHADRLAADMLAGRFKISPDAILRIQGSLANGQHRLEAVVKSGKSQTFLVMESNDEELYKVLDAGLRRTVSDSLIGLPFCKCMPSIARWVQAYETKTVNQAVRTGSEARDKTEHAPTQCELIEYCQSNSDILGASAAFVNPLYTQTKLLPLSIGAAIHAIASRRPGGEEEAKAFLRKLYLEGGNNAAGDLRNRLIANRGSKSKLNLGYIFGITIKAFKSYCTGTRPGVLKWVKGEPFPTL